MNNFNLKKFLVENKLTTNSRIDEAQASKELIDFGKEVHAKLQTVNNAFKFQINMNATNFNMFDKVAKENTGGFAILGQGNELAIVTHTGNKALLQDVISKFSIADNANAVLDDSTKKAVSDTSYEIRTIPGKMYFAQPKPGVLDSSGVSKVTIGVNGKAIKKN